MCNPIAGPGFMPSRTRSRPLNNTGSGAESTPRSRARPNPSNAPWAPCIAHATNDQVGGGVPGDGPSPNDSWGYQSCTETLHAFSTPSGSWRSFTFDKASLDAQCQQYYNVTPDTHHLEKWGGGYAIADKNLTTNLIWSNGELVRGGGRGESERQSADRCCTHTLAVKRRSHTPLAVNPP